MGTRTKSAHLPLGETPSKINLLRQTTCCIRMKFCCSAHYPWMIHSRESRTLLDWTPLLDLRLAPINWRPYLSLRTTLQLPFPHFRHWRRFTPMRRLAQNLSIMGYITQGGRFRWNRCQDHFHSILSHKKNSVVDVQHHHLSTTPVGAHCLKNSTKT